MANVFATKTGNWTDTTVWNTGALPTASDDVYANGFTVTINTSPTVLSIRNTLAAGINAGGGFTATSGMVLTVTGDGVIAGSVSSTTCLLLNLSVGSSCTINGNVTGGSASDSYGIRTQGSGIVNIFGTVRGGTGGNSPYGIRQDSGTVNVTGNLIAGSSNFATALLLNGPGTAANIIGNVTGGTQSNCFGIYNNSTGVFNITGNITGGSLSNNTAAGGLCSNGITNITGQITGGFNSAIGFLQTGGQLNITGDIIGGPAAGVSNSSSGTFTQIGTVYSSTTAPGIDFGSVSQVTILTGPFISTSGTGVLAAASGVNPCIAARWFIKDTELGTFSYTMRGETVSGSPSSRPARVLALPEGYNAAYPLASDVRSPVTFGPDGIYSGTMIVPDPSSVLPAVPIDDTVGTANLQIDADSFWSVPTSTTFAAGSVGERFMRLATMASVGDQIAAMKQATT